MCKIPITLYPWDIEMWTDQTWTRQDTLSSRFDFLAAVDWLTAFHLTGLGKQWLSQGIYTGWVLGGAGRGGTPQARPVFNLQIRVLTQYRCTGPMPPTAHLYLHSIFWVCLDVSHPLVSPDHYSSAYIPACSGGFFRDRLVSNDMKLPWCYKPHLYVFIYPATMYIISFCIFFPPLSPSTTNIEWVLPSCRCGSWPLSSKVNQSTSVLAIHFPVIMQSAGEFRNLQKLPLSYMKKCTLKFFRYFYSY